MDNTFPLTPNPANAPDSTVANATPPGQEPSGKEFSPALDNAIADLDKKTQGTESTAEVGKAATVTDATVTGATEAGDPTVLFGTETGDLSTDDFPSAKNILSAEIVGSLNTPMEDVTPQPQGASKTTISTNKNELPVLLSDITPIGSEKDTATKAPAKAETILLQQIQHILDEGKDKGTIVIKASTEGVAAPKENGTPLNILSSPVLANASENTSIQAKQNIAQVIMPEEHAKTLSNSLSSPVLDDASKNTTVQAKQNIAQVIMPEEHAKTLSNSLSSPVLDDASKNTTIQAKQNIAQVIMPEEHAKTLSNSLSSPVLDDASKNTTIQVKQYIAQVMMPEERSKTLPGTANTRSESTRQDVTEQFINAKLNGAEKERNDTSQQHHDQKGNEGQNKNTFQQTVTTNSTTVSPERATGEASFGHQLGLGSGSTITTNTTTNSHVGIEGKFAPGAHTPVAEQEIVDTLIQKFNVNPRLQTSKITMQLHPAELGSLKIDVVVKDGSISAHIVTQSHQVLETLDKNISRLREVLQNQGYQVDDFQITLNTDRGNEQQLFQEQFESKQQDFMASEKAITPETETFDTLLQEQEEFNDLPNKLYKVNLTA